MDVDEYMELDQYYEEKCARLELLNAQMLEALEMACERFENATLCSDCENCFVKAAIRAAKGE